MSWKEFKLRVTEIFEFQKKRILKKGETILLKTEEVISIFLSSEDVD